MSKKKELLELPFFSKVSIRYAVKALRRMGASKLRGSTRGIATRLIP
jgi:hypothetical protein